MSTQTIDSTDVNSSPTRRPGESPRQQSVCIEIPISVHGSRSASGSLNNTQAAKPFLEETRTMIVFPQGAVLRLTEPVSEGQILILKNSRVKQEVACRVVSSKTNSSAKGYIEVEFFQPAPGFWGITFPAAMPVVARPETAPSAPAPSKPRVEPSALKPAFFQPPPPRPVAPVEPVLSTPVPSPEPVVPVAVISQPPISIPEPSVTPVYSAPVQAEQPTPIVPVRVAPPLTPDSTQELNRAIAAAYASPVERKPAKKIEPVQEVKPVVKDVVATPPAPAPSIANVAPPAPTKSLNPTKPKSVPVVKPSGESVPSTEPLAMADSIGYPAPQGPASASVSSVKLNRASAQASSSSIETRKIELTSSQIASEAVVGRPMFGSGADSSSEQGSGSGKTWIIAVAAVVLLGLGAGTYWWTSIRKASAAKTDAVSAVVPPSAPLTAPAGAAQPGIMPTGSNSQPATNPTSTQNSAAAPKQGATPGGAASNSLLAKSEKNSSPVNSRRPNVLPAEKIAAPVAHSTSNSIAATPAPDVTTNSAVVPTGSLSSILPGMGQPSSVPAPPSRPSGPPPSASVLQQPKLLQTTSPIYPKIAATRGDWGDVVIDALVGETGRVTDTKVISGPDTLRQAALQVVRTQTYQPAKLNGKPVSMHVTVKIPFPKPR